MKTDRASGSADFGGKGAAVDPRAPYVRLAVVGLICRDRGRGEDAGCHRGVETSGRWLLLHRREPVEVWDPPGGRMERGEDLTTAVVREVAEETGLAVEVGGPCYALLTLYKGERLLAVSMACRPMSDPDLLTLEPDGASEGRWVSVEEWEHLAADGRSSWDAGDVRKATRMATILWEAENE
jgi:8-oxo-dGTP pyrophosphatase MutT (NUDIX family)